MCFSFSAFLELTIYNLGINSYTTSVIWRGQWEGSIFLKVCLWIENANFGRGTVTKSEKSPDIFYGWSLAQILALETTFSLDK